MQALYSKILKLMRFDKWEVPVWQHDKIHVLA